MGETGGEFLVKRLVAWGVRRIYGYAGDGVNGILGAMNREQGTTQFVQAAHEEVSAFMACAHAKYTGEVGVCMATSGPKAIHLLNGLYDAKLDGQPVVAIVGQQARSSLGGSFQQPAERIVGAPKLRDRGPRHVGARASCPCLGTRGRPVVARLVHPRVPRHGPPRVCEKSAASVSTGTAAVPAAMFADEWVAGLGRASRGSVPQGLRRSQ